MLGISGELPQESVIDLLISFNHPDFASIPSEKRIAFQTHSGTEADLIFPLAVFSESSGSLINEAGTVQQCAKAIFRNEPVPSVTEWIAILGLGGEKR